jgi:hypothetical protein
VTPAGFDLGSLLLFSIRSKFDSGLPGPDELAAFQRGLVDAYVEAAARFGCRLDRDAVLVASRCAFLAKMAVAPRTMRAVIERRSQAGPDRDSLLAFVVRQVDDLLAAIGP